MIFNNPSYSEFEEKIKNLNKKMINYFITLKDWLEEEILDTEAMFLATEMIDGIMEKEDKTSQKLETIEAEFKKVESGGSSFKTLFKKKVNVIAEITKEKDETQNKLDNLRLLVKILADNMEKPYGRIPALFPKNRIFHFPVKDRTLSILRSRILFS